MNLIDDSTIWQCQKCGTCCRLFVFSGVKLEEDELGIFLSELSNMDCASEQIKQIEEMQALQMVGEMPPRACIFLVEDLCSIHEVRPNRCREYPTMLDKERSIVHVSLDCPRGSAIAEILRTNPPKWIVEAMGSSDFEVIATSFYEPAISRFFGEED